MSVQKGKDGVIVVKCRSQKTNKYTTIRRNPRTGKHFESELEAMNFEHNYINGQVNKDMKFGELFEEYHQYTLLSNPNDYDLLSWYKNHLSKYASKKAISFKPADLTFLQQEMKNKGYSINFINKIVGLINTILNFGVSQGMLDDNPCKHVKPLKMIKTKMEEDLYWTPEQFKQVILSIPEAFPNVSSTEYIRDLLLFGYYTGMRYGEIRALTWRKINFTQKKITVNAHIAKRNVHKAGRKNNGVLAIYMDDNLYELLQDMYNEVKNTKGWTKDAYIFYSHRLGFYKPLGSNTGNKWIQALAEYNDLPHITFHGLRHSAASYYISVVHLDPYEVAARLGDTVDVVLNVYAAFFNDSKKETANKISQHSDDFKNIRKKPEANE